MNTAFGRIQYILGKTFSFSSAYRRIVGYPSNKARLVGALFTLNALSTAKYFLHRNVSCDQQPPQTAQPQQPQTLFTSEAIRSKIKSSIVLIYSERTQKPIATGIAIDDEGTFITISNIFDLDSKHPSHQFYARSLSDSNDDTEFSFSIDYTLDAENISFCSIKKQASSQHIPFKKCEFLQGFPMIGSRVYVYGKSNADYGVIEEGLVNENKLSSEQAFDFSAQSFLLMANIQNRHTSLYGAPLVDEQGRIIAMNYPIPNSFVKSHLIAVPAYYLHGIISQYCAAKEVRKPYVGLSVKWTQDIQNGGAFIIKVNSEGPGAKAELKLGEIITEVDGIKIKDGKDLSRAIGYEIGQTYTLKVFRNGKSRLVQLKTE